MKNLILLISLFTFCSFTYSPSNTPANDNSSMQDRWELLGTRTVKFINDRDEINVTAKEGLFTALRVKVLRSAMDMNKMTVHFGDGSSEDIEMRNSFKAGDQSRIIDLPGNRRIIKKVVFWYDTKNYKKRRAVVELWGRH